MGIVIFEEKTQVQKLDQCAIEPAVDSFMQHKHFEH